MCDIVAKSKEAMAGLSKIRQRTKQFKDLRIGSWNVLSLYRSKSLWKMPGSWGREIGGMLQGIGIAGRSV